MKSRAANSSSSRCTGDSESLFMRMRHAAQRYTASAAQIESRIIHVENGVHIGRTHGTRAA